MWVFEVIGSIQMDKNEDSPMSIQRRSSQSAWDNHNDTTYGIDSPTRNETTTIPTRHPLHNNLIYGHINKAKTGDTSINGISAN